MLYITNTISLQLPTSQFNTSYSNLFLFFGGLFLQKVGYPAMALQGKSSLLLLLIALLSLGNTVSATVFTLMNHCSYTIWPATISGDGAANLGNGGFPLPPDASATFTAQPGWSGRFWARTGCNFDESGKGICTTGDCGGLNCPGGGAPPVSLAEFTLGVPGTDHDKDFYDVSLVDGYNVGLGIKPLSGVGDCKYAGCIEDLNVKCPSELTVLESGSSNVVACKSACAAFNTPEFCCTGAHSTPETCGPTRYSEMFKTACPTAYSYAYDDASSTFTCRGTDYLITFCPSSSSSS